MKQKQVPAILYVLVTRCENDHGYIYPKFSVCYMSGLHRLFKGRPSASVIRFIHDHINSGSTGCYRRTGECLITASDQGVSL